VKIAVIGPASSVVGFKALGLDAFAVARPEDAQAVWESLDPEQYAIIFVVENLFEKYSEQIELFRPRAFPIITAIPPVSGEEGASIERLRSLVEKAVGTDVMMNE
jgi:V/A-type H+/Na+-transporting ATPase subunit F